MKFKNLKINKKIFLTAFLLLIPIITVCIYNTYKVIKMNAALKKLEVQYRGISAAADLAGEKLLCAELEKDKALSDKFYAEAGEYIAQLESIIQEGNIPTDVKDKSEIVITNYKSKTYRNKLPQYCDGIKASVDRKIKAEISILGSWIKRSKTEQFIGLSLCVVIGLLTVFYFSERIVKPLNQTVLQTEKITGGDLTETLNESKYTDEAGSLRTTISQLTVWLRDIISNIKSASNDIISASYELNTSAENIRQKSVLQSSLTDEVSAEMQEMSASIEQNSNNSSAGTDTAQKTLSSVKKCYKSAIKTVEAMNEITDKISIINSIAFQTNILALNAAVEASRAGDSGKGFSVVASDIKKLAERSAIAAKSINEVSAKGSSAAKAAHEVFSRVMPEIEKTSALVNEISVSSREQSSSSAQINSAVQGFSQTTREFASIAEEVAVNSGNISMQAEKLENLTEYFKL